jgi:hypothetical protein
MIMFLEEYRDHASIGNLHMNECQVATQVKCLLSYDFTLEANVLRQKLMAEVLLTALQIQSPDLITPTPPLT